jgi:hypothetical protein
VQAAYVDFTRPACDAFVRHGVGRVVGISAQGKFFMTIDHDLKAPTIATRDITATATRLLLDSPRPAQSGASQSTDLESP